MKGIIAAAIVLLLGGLTYIKFFSSDFSIKNQDEIHAIVKTITVDVNDSPNQVETTFNEVLEIYSSEIQTGIIRTIMANAKEYTLQIGYLVSDPEIVPPESMTIITIPAAKVAKLRVIGPYKESYKSFSKLINLINENKLKINGPPYQLFYDDPAFVDEDRLEADIIYPVE